MRPSPKPPRLQIFRMRASAWTIPLVMALGLSSCAPENMNSVQIESADSVGFCTQDFVDSYNTVARARNAVLTSQIERESPDFESALAACTSFQEKNVGVRCRTIGPLSGREFEIESAKVIQSCEELKEQARLHKVFTASDGLPIEQRARTLRFKIDDDLLLNDMLNGSGAPIMTSGGVACILKRDNPTGVPVEIADVYRVRLAIQFALGESMSSYIWFDGNALVLECLKPGLTPITVLDLKTALEDQAEITILPDSL